MAEENTGTAGGAAQTEPTETTNADTAATPEGAATMLTDGAATPTDESAAKPEGSTWRGNTDRCQAGGGGRTGRVRTVHRR